jgi:hypothetical protein
MSAYITYFDNTKSDLQNQWIQANLNPDETTSLITAQDNNSLLWASYQDQGLLIPEDIYETVYIPEFNTNIDVLIGTKLILANGVSPSQLQLHPDWATWLLRLPQDIFLPDSVLES